MGMSFYKRHHNRDTNGKNDTIITGTKSDEDYRIQHNRSIMCKSICGNSFILFHNMFYNDDFKSGFCAPRYAHDASGGNTE
jgi:hypothetical protein